MEKTQSGQPSRNSSIHYTETDGYLYPVLQVSNQSEADTEPLGKYGRMALKYLKQNHPRRFMTLRMQGELMPLMHRLNTEAYNRMEMLKAQMEQLNPVPNPENFMESYRHRQMIHDTAEEIILKEYIHIPR